jgi:hypothetical protein
MYNQFNLYNFFTNFFSFTGRKVRATQQSGDFESLVEFMKNQSKKEEELRRAEIELERQRMKLQQQQLDLMMRSLSAQNPGAAVVPSTSAAPIAPPQVPKYFRDEDGNMIEIGKDQRVVEIDGEEHLIFVGNLEKK